MHHCFVCNAIVRTRMFVNVYRFIFLQIFRAFLFFCIQILSMMFTAPGFSILHHCMFSISVIITSLKYEVFKIFRFPADPIVVEVPLCMGTQPQIGLTPLPPPMRQWDN